MVYSVLQYTTVTDCDACKVIWSSEPLLFKRRQLTCSKQHSLGKEIILFSHLLVIGSFVSFFNGDVHQRNV